MFTLRHAMLCACLVALGCAGHAPSVSEAAAPETPSAPIALNAITARDGELMGPLGVFTLMRDPAHPLTARLELERSGSAQGDGYELSIRPFLNAASLQVIGLSSGPNNTTDYQVRFTHPIPMPTDLDPPASAAKRVDLFVFDVNLVLTVEGTDSFFGGAVKTNLSALQNASGYRQLGPMVTASSIGITNGTNTFPYALVTRADMANPKGNYDDAEGWTGAEYLAPTGYDVVPQGAQADTIMRIPDSLATPLPIVVMAKYMDPRGGSTLPLKRANRLPSADPTSCRYFLPQAAGDLQSISVATVGDLFDNSSAESSNLDGTLLDWDNSATVAASFPNQAAITQIAETSRPAQVDVSIPKLKATGTFPGLVGASSGLINQFVAVSASISNVDRSFTVTEPSGEVVSGLLRVKDTQDATLPTEYILDESLQPQTLPPGFEPSTRYQVVTVKVRKGAAAPVLTGVSPLAGVTGSGATFSATNAGGPATSWSWNFGGGAAPNTSVLATPNVTLGAIGSYGGTVTASNASGSSAPFNFTLSINDGKPVISNVTPNSGYALRTGDFSATVANSPTSWSWNFGGGANPNTSIAASPSVTFGIAGSYSGTVTASNSFGSSPGFPFSFTVANKILPLRIRVFTNGATYPPKLTGLANWNLLGITAWVTTYVNPIYVNSGVQIDTSNIDFAPINNPTLFNIDTATEANDLIFNYVLAQAPDRLNCFVINSIPYNPTVGGEMQDTGCNHDNTGRGCWIKPYGTAFDQVVMPHELGHIQDLVHIRVVGPINPLNFNLMSYGTTDTSLSASIITEVGGSCRTYSCGGGDTINQLRIQNDWAWTWGP